MIAKMAREVCTRARKMAADNQALLGADPVEDAARQVYMEEVKDAPPQTSFPDWHVHALGAIEQLEASDAFRPWVFDPSPFDRAQAAAQPGSPAPQS